MGPSKRNRPNNNTNESPEAKHSAHDKEKGANMFWNVIKSAAFWTAVFTGFLCLFTYLLYEVSKDATNASKEQARAIVSFGGFAIGPSLTDQATKTWQGQQFQVNWFNNGILPGKGASFQQTSKPFFDDLPKTFDFPLESEKVQGIVPPKGQFGGTITIPRSELEDNWRGKARIFVWGTAVYRDGFSDSPVRVSEFCSEIFQVTASYTALPQVAKGESQKPPVLGDPNTAITGLSWKTCNRGAHNCYDEDCSDYAEQIKNIAK
jgi:hypothetical protein